MSTELAEEKKRNTELNEKLNKEILEKSEAKATAIVLEGELNETRKDLKDERLAHQSTRDKSERRRVARDHYRSIALNADKLVHQYGLGGTSTPIEEHVAMADEALSYPGLSTFDSSEAHDD